MSDKRISRCPRHKGSKRLPENCHACHVAWEGHQHALRTYDYTRGHLDKWIRICTQNAMRNDKRDEYAGISSRYQVEGRRLYVPDTQGWRRERYADEETATTHEQRMLLLRAKDEYKVLQRRAARWNPDSVGGVSGAGVEPFQADDGDPFKKGINERDPDKWFKGKDPTADTAIRNIQEQRMRQEVFPLVHAAVESYQGKERRVLKLLLADENVEDLSRVYGFNYQTVRAILHRRVNDALWQYIWEVYQTI
jgi:hypothetical protein